MLQGFSVTVSFLVEDGKVQLGEAHDGVMDRLGDMGTILSELGSTGGQAFGATKKNIQQ